MNPVSNNIQTSSNPNKALISYGNNVKHAHNKENNQKETPIQPLSNKKKLGIFVTTLAGVSLVMASLLKGKGYNLDYKKILKTSPKNWGIFNAKYGENEIPLMVIKLGLGSVAGGLLGGALFDKKENMGAKIRESVIQIIGNIGTPLACVFFGMKGFKKIEPQIMKHIPTLKSIKADKILKGVPGVLATGISLCIGIILGNKVGNLINQNVFNVNENRKLKLADMSPHVDDLCVALTIAGSEYPVIPRIIPAALMVAGYSAGTAQDKHPKHKPNVIEEPVT